MKHTSWRIQLGSFYWSLSYFFLYQFILEGTNGLGLHGVLSYLLCILIRVTVEKVKCYSRLTMPHSSSLTHPFCSQFHSPETATSQCSSCCFWGFPPCIQLAQQPASCSSTDFLPGPASAESGHPLLTLCPPSQAIWDAACLKMPPFSP